MANYVVTVNGEAANGERFSFKTMSLASNVVADALRATAAKIAENSQILTAREIEPEVLVDALNAAANKATKAGYLEAEIRRAYAARHGIILKAKGRKSGGKAKESLLSL